MRAVFAVVIAVVWCGLAASEPSKEDKAKTDAAKAGIDVLDKAVKAYRAKSGEFPADLKALLEDKALVEPKDLTDPWGNEYQYDVSGKHNDGKKPDIWCEAPDKKVIGNWPEKK